MITAVTTCMGRLEHLKTTLPMMLEEFDDVIVVDWSCPQKSGKWAYEQGAHVVYQPEQKTFSACKARNLGARNVKTRSVCFIDADVLPMPGVKKEIERSLNLSTMVISARTPENTDVHSLSGFIAVDIGQFWGVGGYDESLTGYALEDAHLRARLLFERGILAKRLPPECLAAIRHSNEMRGQFFKEPIKVSATRNHKLLRDYLAKHGVSDWVNDNRTAEIAYRGI
jgi:hypothetical protein